MGIYDRDDTDVCHGGHGVKFILELIFRSIMKLGKPLAGSAELNRWAARPNMMSLFDVPPNYAPSRCAGRSS